MLRRNAEASSTALIWVSIISVSLIMVSWIATEIYPVRQELGRLQTDIDAFRGIISDACDAETYAYTYNPVTEQGIITFNMTEICVSTTRTKLCDEATCSVNPPAELRLENLTTIQINKRADDTFTFQPR